MMLKVLRRYFCIRQQGPRAGAEKLNCNRAMNKPAPWVAPCQIIYSADEKSSVKILTGETKPHSVKFLIMDSSEDVIVQDPSTNRAITKAKE
jgi:hypothetical protein